MGGASFIAGDWGTSNLRLYLCAAESDGRARILDGLRGPGAAQVQDFEETLFGLIADWREDRGNLPVLLSGMVGSTIGWREAPYTSCPASETQIIDGGVAMQVQGAEIRILGGLRTTNPLGQPDVMRGEELQLLGLMRLHPETADTTRLVCLPGTHNKWARLTGDRVETFSTAFTGELFALLSEHSILIGDSASAAAADEAFHSGVELASRLENGQLLHALFSTRSRQLSGDLAASQAQAYLSGLLIGSDIAAAARLFPECFRSTAPVAVLGDGIVADAYGSALQLLGYSGALHAPDEVALAAYTALYRHHFAGDS